VGRDGFWCMAEHAGTVSVRTDASGRGRMPAAALCESAAAAVAVLVALFWGWQAGMHVCLMPCSALTPAGILSNV
jgi:hypothetical protein